MKEFFIKCLLCVLFLLTGVAYAAPTANMPFDKFTVALKEFNAEIASLQQKQLPFIYKRYCMTDEETLRPDKKNGVLCGSLFHNANFLMQDSNEGNWIIDDLSKGVDYQHFSEGGRSFNFIRAQVFTKNEGYVALADIYYPAPDFKVLLWKVPEIFEGKMSWAFAYRNNNIWHTYHVDQQTGFILNEAELRYETIPGRELDTVYHKDYYRSYFTLESKVDLPDSYFLEAIGSSFSSYEEQALIATFYQLFMPLLWLVFFSWLFCRLVIPKHGISYRVRAWIFVLALLEPFFVASFLYVLTDGAYMDWMVHFGEHVRRFFETAMHTSTPQIRASLASFNAIFIVDAVHIVFSLALAYPFVRFFLHRHYRR